ncbi:MAG: pyridoxal 5'-phosphate synthase glutaminase subunit PdxT [Spirochaetia bacterium]|nr:pyridoxal 5'-phosphate synthase glutaminase subunit PdxT [Spirochaetia bacterium]NCC89592.1 pyridoxal 5'-phosphate synthase glutaminase subunit PdxT [Spirochaetia bacterium]
MKVGVLALQGGFAEHLKSLSGLGVEGFQVKSRSDISKGLDALIIPGGESTVIGKLVREAGLYEPLLDLITSGLPVFGTCAGMILLASTIENDSTVHFGTFPITVKRNAFGRQLGSFHANGNFGDIGDVPMTFIRAPIITKAADEVSILTEINGHIVAAQYGKLLVTAFHPELTDDLTVHAYFLDHLVRGQGLA